MPASDYILGLRKHCGHELLLLPGVSAIIVNDDGHVLLQRRADNGEWATVGGAVDPGENVADAVVREAREETGLHVQATRLAGVYTSREIVYPNRDRAQYVTAVFRCKIIGGSLEPLDGESAELVWFAPDDLPTDLHNDFRRTIRDALPEHGEARW